MIAEINAAIQSTKALNDLLKATRELRNAHEFAAAINEISTKLTQMIGVAAEAREKQLALADEVHELKEENMKLKNWDREAERYQLTYPAPGIPARTLKPGMENGELPHELCANCFARNQQSFLQHGPNADERSCNQCGSSWFPVGEEPNRARAW